MSPARCFLNRMIQLLRGNYNTDHIAIADNFHCDLNWFNTFLSQYDGVTYFDERENGLDLYLDAQRRKLRPLMYASPLS